MDKINEFKANPHGDSQNRNKLRTYCKLKGSFTQEPYISLVRNRNQRAFLTRLRVSSHNLGIELGRRTQPITPLDKRKCIYCQHNSPDLSQQGSSANMSQPNLCLDDELHFLVHCPTFTIKRNCLYGKIECLVPNFKEFNDFQKFVQMLCPTTPQAAKLVSKFCKIMFECRKKLDEGSNMHDLGFLPTLRV